MGAGAGVSDALVKRDVALAVISDNSNLSRQRVTLLACMAACGHVRHNLSVIPSTPTIQATVYGFDSLLYPWLYLTTL